MAVTASISISFQARETSALDLATGIADHGLPNMVWNFASGTGSNAVDLVYSDTMTVTSTPTDLDLRGSLASALATTFAPVEIRAWAIRNNSQTVGEYISVGGDAAAAYVGLFAAANDVIIVQPGGAIIWVAPYDTAGFQTTATSADILQIVAATGSVSVSVMAIGVSA